MPSSFQRQLLLLLLLLGKNQRCSIEENMQINCLSGPNHTLMHDGYNANKWMVNETLQNMQKTPVITAILG